MCDCIRNLLEKLRGCVADPCPTISYTWSAGKEYANESIVITVPYRVRRKYGTDVRREERGKIIDARCPICGKSFLPASRKSASRGKEDV
jgi:hypothetical protein